MTTATLPLTAANGAGAPKRKGWFRRSIDRAVEARLRSVEADINRRLANLEPELREQGRDREMVGKDWTLPFVRGA